MVIIQKKKVVWLMLLILFICTLMPHQVHGEEPTEATYYVKPLLPENQRKEVSDYFDVQLRGEKEQTLELEIHNNTEEKMTFTAVLENAITNDHGVIEYQHEEVDYDKSLQHKLTDIGKVKDVIEVEPGNLSKAEIVVTMPEEAFDGIILGGIRVSEKQSEASQSQAGISNVFSYVIPIKVWQNESAVPNKLNFQGVSIGQQSFENVIKARLQNPQTTILRELTLVAKVFKKDGKEPMYEETREEMKLAPNSHFDYSISLGTSEFKAGNYRLELSAKAEGIDESWQETFEISGKEAKELNKGMAFKKPPVNWKMYTLIIAFVIALFVIGWLLYRQKKLQQKSKEAMETKKMKKRKRVKRHTKKMMLVLLASASLAVGARVSAESAPNNGISDATIVIKPQVVPTKETTPSTSTSPSTATGQTTKRLSTTPTKKILPQTGENQPTNQQLVSLGSVMLLCATTVIIKRERGQKDEK